jgi:hypothetical protein
MYSKDDATLELMHTIEVMLDKYQPEEVFKAVYTVWAKLLSSSMQYVSLELLSQYLAPLYLSLLGMGLVMQFGLLESNQELPC